MTSRRSRSRAGGGQLAQLAGKVLVLGQDTRAFLSVIRSLGRAGLSLHVAWCESDVPAARSRYIAERHELARYETGGAWKAELTALLERERYDLVIPCDDPCIIPLQLHRAELTAICPIYLLDDECYRVANDKFAMAELVARLGIPTPPERAVDRSTDVAGLLGEFSLPVVLKPRSSFTERNLLAKRSVVKLFSEESLRAELAKLADGEVLSAQANFIGRGVGVELLACEGELLYAFQHLRVHEPLTGGGSSYRRSTPVAPELLEASRKIVAALDYTGVAMVEFKLNPTTGDWIFIELNARFWGSLPLAVAAGADFPRFLYELVVEGRRDFDGPDCTYRCDIYCRNLTNDLAWLVANWRADRKDPVLETRSLGEVAGELVNVLRLRERSDTFTRDDMGPGFAELTFIFERVLAKVFTALRKRTLSLPVSRARDRQRSLARIAGAKSVLFVCKGNICRSPFAHHYLARAAPELEVVSTGYYPRDGRACPDAAVEAARRHRVDLSLHRSTRLDRASIDRADVVVTFDEENWRTVIAGFPAARAKLVRLSGLDRECPLEIEDPYSRDVEFFSATYRQIIQALAPLAARSPQSQMTRR